MASSDLATYELQLQQVSHKFNTLIVFGFSHQFIDYLKQLCTVMGTINVFDVTIYSFSIS